MRYRVKVLAPNSEAYWVALKSSSGAISLAAPWELVELSSVAYPEGTCWTSEKSSASSTILSMVSLDTIYSKNRYKRCKNNEKNE